MRRVMLEPCLTQCLFNVGIPSVGHYLDYLTKYIERMGTGTRDMIAKCRAAGLPEPEFTLTDGFVTTLRRPKAPASVDQATAQATKLVKYLDSKFLEEFAHALNLSGAQVTAQATTQVAKVLAAANREAGVPRDELQNSAAITHREHFRKAYLEPLLKAAWLERTLPDKPTSPKQRYRTTVKGMAWLQSLPPAN